MHSFFPADRRSVISPSGDQVGDEWVIVPP
jgi:hypothetical protein